MEKAIEGLKEADDALKQSHFKMSVNRSYYAMFTAARALLAMKEKDSSKQVWKNKVSGTYGKEKVYFIGINELIRSKRKSTQNQDKVDLEILLLARSKLTR